jgi:hypothetical protein
MSYLLIKGFDVVSQHTLCDVRRPMSLKNWDVLICINVYFLIQRVLKL